MKRNKDVDKTAKIEFVGTRGEACSVFFEQLSLSSKDPSSRQYYTSLANLYRRSGQNEKRRFRAIIEKVN